MYRKPLLVGNWKMNLDHLESTTLVQKILLTLSKKYINKVDLVIIPPFTSLNGIQTLINKKKLHFAYGAQNISQYEYGAYTGEVSGYFLKKLGCSFVLIGHSERRIYFCENNTNIANKAKIAFKFGIAPIICIGEKLKVRQNKNHIKFNLSSLRNSLASLSKEQISDTIIAYEPLWAIGTGKLPSVLDIQEMCKAIREEIEKLSNSIIAREVRIIYGGSVNNKNINTILSNNDVDGALIGSASLNAKQFATIINLI